MGQCVENWVQSGDGTKLLYRRWSVDGAKGSVAIIPGYADHSGRYGHVAEALNAAGLDVFGIDLRGHGGSEGPRGYVSRFEDYHADVDALMERVEAESSAGKRFVFGHSMGGLVVLHHAIRQGATWDGAMISSPLLGIYVKVPAIKRVLGSVMSAIYPKFSLPSGLDPAHISHDSEMVRAYAEDPLVFEISTARWFTEAMRAIEETKAGAERFTVPCLLMQAGDDRIADPRCAKPLFEAIGAADKQYIEYAGFYHELVNEVDRARVLKDMTDWLADRV